MMKLYYNMANILRQKGTAMCSTKWPRSVTALSFEIFMIAFKVMIKPLISCKVTPYQNAKL